MRRLSTGLITIGILAGCGTSGSKGPTYDRAALERAAVTESDVAGGYTRNIAAERRKSSTDKYKTSAACKSVIKELGVFGEPTSGSHIKRIFKNADGLQLEEQLSTSGLTIGRVRDLFDKCRKLTYDQRGVRLDVMLSTEDNAGYGDDDSFVLRITVDYAARIKFRLHGYDIVFRRGNALAQVSGFGNVTAQGKEIKLDESMVERLAKKADKKLDDAA